MDKELMLDVGQANELKLAFRRAGWTNRDVKRLTEGFTLEHILPIVRGYAEVMPYTIDCDANPFVPYDWHVMEHRKMGLFEWDPTRIELFWSSDQRASSFSIADSDKVRQELAEKVVLNANVLDWLLQNPHLIPDEWMQKVNGVSLHTYFWGTIYANAHGDLFVRCLHRSKVVRWDWGYVGFGKNWVCCGPSAVLVS
ncbi:MAG: hypothetical protein AAB581_03090 [Patescibacteria group bacterium]